MQVLRLGTMLAPPGHPQTKIDHTRQKARAGSEKYAVHDLPENRREGHRADDPVDANGGLQGKRVHANPNHSGILLQRRLLPLEVFGQQGL